jgi:hypothetical protein
MFWEIPDKPVRYLLIDIQGWCCEFAKPGQVWALWHGCPSGLIVG